FRVEVFVKENEVAPMRVNREAAVRSVAGTASIFGAQEQSCKSPCQFFRHFSEIHQLAGTGWKFDTKIITVKVVIAFESLDQKIVQRKPNWAAPVRVAAEK